MVKDLVEKVVLRIGIKSIQVNSHNMINVKKPISLPIIYKLRLNPALYHKPNQIYSAVFHGRKSILGVNSPL